MKVKDFVFKGLKHVAFGIVLTMSTVFYVGMAEAAPVFSSTGGSFMIRDDVTGTQGNRIRVGPSTVDINALGFEDLGGDGFVIAHQVGLWDAGGTLLRSGTLSAGAADPLVDIWRYVEIPTITLQANTLYYIGVSLVTASGDGWTDGIGSAAFDLNPAFTESFAFNSLGGFAFPGNYAGGDPLRWAMANATLLNFSTQADQLVEPGTLALFGVSLVIIGLRRRRVQTI